MSTARGFNWAPTVKVISGDQILNNSIGGTKVITGDPATAGTPKSNGFFDNLGKYGGLALAGLAAYGLYNKYGQDFFGKDQEKQGGGNDQNDENGDPQYWHMDYGYAVPLLVKAIQELKAEFDAYKATHP